MTAIIPAALFLLFAISRPAWAYIGPGAGFAVVSSFFIILLTAVVSLFSFLIWPFRAAWLWFKRSRNLAGRKAGRVVVVGLDGMDPVLTEKYMAQGLLPNFSRLAEEGTFSRLGTTTPPVSPVAWSTFSTGVNPGKHRIFDFYTRDPNNYLPVLSSVEISSSRRRIGPFRFNRTEVKQLRRSESFWKILGDAGVFCSILRVPITFPPDKFHGVCLSGMCVPDLRGTQGSFTLFTSEDMEEVRRHMTGGTVVPLNRVEKSYEAAIPGPVIESKGEQKNLELPLRCLPEPDNERAVVWVDREKFVLKLNKYSPWVRLTFRMGIFRRVSGIARFMIKQLEPELKIYMTPINIDPERPSLPISHPLSFSVAQAKLQGPFSTLGLAEDTWALNERVIDEDDFIGQSYDYFAERRELFFDALKKNTDGLIVEVFDTTDRLQHEFFRCLDDDHPANKDKETEKFREVIRDLYRRMDDFLAEIRAKLRKDDLLMVISDHGFKQFKWGVNLNTWLWKEGYLILKQGCEPGGEWFEGVDWTRTRAYAYGLTGIYLNVRGRERDGIVPPGNDRLRLQLELKEKLEALRMENGGDTNGGRPVHRAILSSQALSGPYVDDAPDLIVGYHEGYRSSWNSATGRITGEVFEDNTRSWSGDHCIDPLFVPGVFFCNWKKDDEPVSLADIGPTILDLFGLEPRGFHDGRVVGLQPGGIKQKAGTVK